jgi:pimeloyl-ACP methyl ester carboxylesterase
MIGFVEAAGLQIAYQREGNGPPIIFLHGFFGDHRVWRRQLELADEYTLVAWDAPGCGESSLPGADFEIRDYANVLEEFIGRVGLDRPHLVGNSFGGTLALQLASTRPELVKSIVGIDTYAGWSGSFTPDIVARRLDASLPDLELPPAEVAAKWITGFVTPEAPEPIKDELRGIIVDFDPAGMRMMIEALAAADLRDVLGEIRAPTLLIWGAQDTRSPLTVARDLRGRLSGSRLVVLEGAGHLAQVEAASRVNADLRFFFKSVDGRA